MHKVGVKARFSAAHSLREYGGNCEKLHGHNWLVEMVCASDELNKLGMVVDFRVLKKALGEVIGELDHSFLNDLEPFREVNPSSENIARHVYEEVLSRLPSDKSVKLVSVRVWENEDSWAEYAGQ